MVKELLDCRDSLTGMDLEQTWEHISYQQGLCSEIRFLDGELRGLRRQLAEAGGLKPEGMSAAAFAGLFDASSASQLRQVMEDVAGVQQSVRRLNRVYAGLLRRSRRSINVPIHTERFASNWELSTSRATEMAKLFITRYEFPPERLSAAGFAEFHPEAPNDTAEGRALNRRVDIVIVAPPTKAPSIPLSGEASNPLRSRVFKEGAPGRRK
jgi:chemotaxis protein MotB